VADNMWEVARLRRLKASTLADAAEEGLRRVLSLSLSLSLGIDIARPLAARWAARDAMAIKAVDVTLARAGLDMEHVNGAHAVRVAQPPGRRRLRATCAHRARPVGFREGSSRRTTTPISIAP
jgi:hypothetical protein